MSLPAATRAAVEALVRTQRQRDEPEEPRVIGVQARPEWSEPASFSLEGESIRVVPCRSALEVRVELVERTDPGEWLMLLTDRDARDLGRDVLDRLARRRLESIDAWSAVAGSFEARGVDAALRRTPDLAGALLDHRPPTGYPPVAGSILDSDTAWTAFAESVFGLGGLDRDPELSVLEWLSSGDAAVALGAVTEPLAEAWWEWLTERVGAVALFGRSLAASGRADHAIALGVCARMLLGAQDVETAKVHGRFEQLAGAKLDDLSLQQVVEAAERAAQSRDLARGEALLGDFEAGALAGRSDLLPSGLSLRFQVAAEALIAALDDPSSLTGAVDAVDVCRRHRESQHRAARLEALTMAVRLARRLGSGARAESASLADAAAWYADDTASVDLARGRIWRGESEPALIEAYRMLDERLFELREGENHRFAVLLADWLKADSSDPRILGVENVLPGIVAPLAGDEPVLLIVMDGMSWPTWVELAADLPRLGWDELADEKVGGRLVGIATVPSATTFSRTSLLTGGLRSGTAKDETKGFAAALAGKAAVLFHKAELIPEGGGNVSPDVLAAIADTKRRVVGIVINEIDDALAGGMQADRRFGIPEIAPLMTCLEAARNAERVCVVTSDHGHVLEYEGAYRSSDGSAQRWRPASEGAEDGETLLAGHRVLAGDGVVVAPWTERVRYTSGKSAGYHGGATPQEMLVPVAVLAPRGHQVTGWRAVGPAIPEWWDDDAPHPAPVSSPRRPAETLLDVAAAEPEWIEELFGSPVYASQRERHVRVAVDDERARRILSVLALRGDRATTVAVAKALDVPEYRARGMISGLRRVLAVDGFDVLAVHEDDITLDRSLLFQQFGLGRDAAT